MPSNLPRVSLQASVHRPAVVCCAAVGAAAAAVPRSEAFLGAPRFGAPRARTLSASFSAAEQTLPSTRAHVGVGATSLLSSKAALLAVGAAAALRWNAVSSIGSGRSNQRRLHVRHLFGGMGKDQEADKDKGDDNGEAAEGSQEEETLTEAQKETCEKLRQEIEELKADAEDKRASHERLKLEVSNFRARTRAELAAARGKAAIPIFKELLPIADEFDLAKQNLKLESDGEREMSAKFSALFEEMLQCWKELGVEKVESLGQPFDPEFHEAISMIPNPEYPADTVCAEMRAGWVIKPVGSEAPQVLRPSLVCVSSG